MSLWRVTQDASIARSEQLSRFVLTEAIQYSVSELLGLGVHVFPPDSSYSWEKSMCRPGSVTMVSFKGVGEGWGEGVGWWRVTRGQSGCPTVHTPYSYTSYRHNLHPTSQQTHGGGGGILLPC